VAVPFPKTGVVVIPVEEVYVPLTLEPTAVVRKSGETLRN